MTKPSTLEVVGEEGGAQESSERLQTFERRRVALTKKLESLTAQLESIQTGEVGVRTAVGSIKLSAQRS
eukprot:COSAG01_NODE_55389_length_325_cov_0.915929_1_plen_68_part_10